MIYLDNAATTLQKPPQVRERMEWAARTASSPGRGGHAYAMQASEIAFACRQAAAAMFHVSNPENVVFTFNATHGLNIAINSLITAGDRVVISGYEHNSVVRPLHALGAEVVTAASPLFDAEAAVEAFQRALVRPAKAVVCNHVSNVFGFALPIEQIAALCRAHGVPLIIDASQSAGAFDIDMERLGAAFLAMPGHKGLYGPQGTGLLLCGVTPRPLLYGGTGSSSILKTMPDFLPDMLEAGTHNTAGIAGLQAGIEYVQSAGTKKILEHERRLAQLLFEGLDAIPGVKVFRSKRLAVISGVVSFCCDTVPVETVGEELAKRGIAVRCGLHCSPAAHETAGTLDTGTVRASVSAFSRRADIAALVGAMRDLEIAQRYV